MNHGHPIRLNENTALRVSLNTVSVLDFQSVISNRDGGI